MKKSILMLLAAILFTAQTWAQDECGYVPDEAYIATWKNKNSIQNKRLKFLKEYSIKDVQKMKEIKYIDGRFKPVMLKSSDIEGEGVEGDLFNGVRRTIPVVAHIVRRSNNTGGLSRANLDASIARANNFYASSNMRFVLCEVKYINSDNIYNHSFSHLSETNSNANASFNKLTTTTRNVSRKLNIYFVPNSTTSWTWRPLIDTRRQHIMMKNSHATNESTLSHEIGHWFDLFHTHNGGDELVNGSNCSTAGDFVCDTAADPNLSGKVNGTTCAYTGSAGVVDANGHTYSPDPRNMMSYSTKPCRDRFSGGQIYRMQSAYLGMNTDRGYTFSFCFTIIKPIWVVGTWTNKDLKTRGITKIIVSDKGKKIQTFGKCHPNDCDWKTVPLKKSGSIYKATYEQGFATKKLSISQSGTNGMKVVVDVDYHDNRQDRRDTYYMKKSKNLILNPGILQPGILRPVLINPDGQ